MATSIARAARGRAPHRGEPPPSRAGTLRRGAEHDADTGDSHIVTSASPATGRPLAGRYRVRGRLGRGATKDVYLAYDERLDRDVALAIVTVTGDPTTARARVEREARVTGRLGDHPNVITVYDTGEL